MQEIDQLWENMHTYLADGYDKHKRDAALFDQLKRFFTEVEDIQLALHRPKKETKPDNVILFNRKVG